MSRKNEQTAPRDQSSRDGNLAPKVRWQAKLLRLLIAFGFGVASSTVFAPLELSHLSWLALIPLLFLIERQRRGHFILGYAWGAGHFIFCLAWLKEVILPAPVAIGMIQALFPAIWAAVAADFLWKLRWPVSRDLDPKAGKIPAPTPHLGAAKQVIIVIALAALWCAMEWCRSWFATGLPWNLLGISMWNTKPLLSIVSYTGVYGPSFLIAAMNIGCYLAVSQWLKRENGLKQNIPFALLASIIFVLIAVVIPSTPVPVADHHLKVTCIQGNIPQIRVPTQKQYDMAKEVYQEQTIWAAATSTPPDLIVWPETALPFPHFKPTPNRDGPPSEYLWNIISKTQIPLLIGALDTTRSSATGDGQDFNSAMLVDINCQRVETYDKIKTVPFGEFLPFEAYYPSFLVNLLKKNDLFMRSLTRGREYTVFSFKEAKIGVNLCYEDVFPEVSRNFVLNGANLLMTLTNDAWYNETSGSHQHLVHAVFRAVETGRPILRSGNNSDTCLILPDGSITAPLVNPHSGGRFYRGRKLYNVPLFTSLPITFYTKYGNLFAHLMTLLSIGTVGYCLYRYLNRRKTILDRCNPTQDVISG
ncbi:apolipoprotein N-acyltransferase [bacterium F16]|nr:apolipoprotein N-acyltransferase [bacterium F16]